MRTVCLHDKREIEQFLRQNPYLHLYALGDLDDFFWQHTNWYALRDIDGKLKEVALVYTGTDLFVLQALTTNEISPMSSMLRSILPYLPYHMHLHLSPGLEEVFSEKYIVESLGLHHKMALTKPEVLTNFDTSPVVPLTEADLPQLKALYEVSYPGNWFDPRMLETGFYFGTRDGDKLTSVAGIHVYSAEYKIAVLGNVTTHPAWRGQGLATQACAKLCQELSKTVDYIGLNVRSDNTAAISAYKKLGFEYFASYNEFDMKLKVS